MNTLISEYYSDSNQKISLVYSYDKMYKVVCLNNYLDTNEESYFDTLNTAEDFAEDWVTE